MKVQCIATPAGADVPQFSHAAVAVIDVLRATSSIIAMLENGAKQVIPVADIETASRLVDSVDQGIKLLAGGFHLRGISKKEIREISLNLQQKGVKGLALSQCTGDPALKIFREEWGDRVVSLDFGKTIRF